MTVARLIRQYTPTYSAVLLLLYYCAHSAPPIICFHTVHSTVLLLLVLLIFRYTVAIIYPLLQLLSVQYPKIRLVWWYTGTVQ